MYIGMTVNHGIFGRGVIVGESEDAYIVKFDALATNRNILKTFGGLKAVNNEKMLQRAGRGELAKSSDLQNLFYRWRSWLDVSDRTLETYSKGVKYFLAWLSDNGIKQPCREDVQAWKDHLKESCRPSSVQVYLMAVKQFFKWLARENLYQDVADRVKGIKIDKGHKKDCLTAGQVKSILSSVDRGSIAGLRDYAIIALMVTTGLRTIEISRANFGDIRTVGSFTALFIQGKGRTEKNEYVKLTEPVEAAIRCYLKARGNVKDDDPLFCCGSNRGRGGRLGTRSISRIIKTRLDENGLNSSRLTAHSLRHTAATLNLLAGGSVEETQQLLRHTSINTTMIYAHALERAGNESERRITESIGL